MRTPAFKQALFAVLVAAASPVLAEDAAPAQTAEPRQADTRAESNGTAVNGTAVNGTDTNGTRGRRALPRAGDHVRYARSGRHAP